MLEGKKRKLSQCRQEENETSEALGSVIRCTKIGKFQRKHAEKDSNSFEIKRRQITQQINQVKGKRFHYRESSLIALENIPTEVFCHVLSYLGPRSRDLIALSQVSVSFYNVMKSIGDAMLERAKSAIQGSLNFSTKKESSISLFVRLARECYQVQNHIIYLEELGKKNFSTLHSSEIDNALDSCLRLLNRRCSKHQETKILSICGKCGGKAYKISRQNSNKFVSNPQSFQKKASLLITFVIFKKFKKWKADHNQIKQHNCHKVL